jgi:hypothetical protein
VDTRKSRVLHSSTYRAAVGMADITKGIMGIDESDCFELVMSSFVCARLGIKLVFERYIKLWKKA